MVADSRATVRADRLRPLNAPRRVRVETDERDRPVAVYVRGQGIGDRGQGQRRGQVTGDRGQGVRVGPPPQPLPQFWGRGEDKLPLPLGEGWGEGVATIGDRCSELGGQGDAETRRRGDTGSDSVQPERVEGRVAASPRRVTETLDRWRIDDEWWRREISRMYYHVALEGGLLLTLFHDLTGGGWFVQTTAKKRESRSARE